LETDLLDEYKIKKSKDMKHHPNSSKHKATHCGYNSKPSRTQVQATLSFFDTRDFSKMTAIVATPGQGKTMLGTQLKLDL
jgi:superfamily II DNA or RNA helicase